MVSVLMKKLAIAAVAGAVMVSASGCSLVSSGKGLSACPTHSRKLILNTWECLHLRNMWKNIWEINMRCRYFPMKFWDLHRRQSS